jgi:hypothetical protein
MLADGRVLRRIRAGGVTDDEALSRYGNPDGGYTDRAEASKPSEIGTSGALETPSSWSTVFLKMERWREGGLSGEAGAPRASDDSEISGRKWGGTSMPTRRAAYKRRLKMVRPVPSMTCTAVCSCDNEHHSMPL